MALNNSPFRYKKGKVLDNSRIVSQVRHENETRLYTILKLIPHLSQTEIVKHTRIPKPTVSRYTIKAQQEGLLVETIDSNVKLYELTEKGKEFLKNPSSLSVSHPVSVGMRKPPTLNKSRVHRLKIKIPIIHDLKIAKWDREVKINNWVKHYVTLDYPYEITIERTTRSVMVYLHSKEFARAPDFTTELSIWLSKTLIFIHEYLKNKQGIKVDIAHAVITDQHIANEIKEYDPATDPKSYASMDLGRRARTVMGTTGQRATAWIDRSHDALEVETNDLTYEEKLILMPELVSKALDTLEGYHEQISRHLTIMGKIEEGISEFNTTVKEFNQNVAAMNRNREMGTTSSGSFIRRVINKIRR